MKLKMHENSLFAVLMRSHWAVSFLIAGGLFGLMRIWLPLIYALFAALPFAVIGSYVAWKQFSAPSPEKIAQRLEAVRAMPAEAFLQALEAGFRREGYGVARVTGPADLELSKSGRVTLVVSKRWKATRTGVGPLEELEALRKSQKADECAYITAGEVSEQARTYAAQKSIRIIDGIGLANLVA